MYKILLSDENQQVLTGEDKEHVVYCKSVEELLDFAKKEAKNNDSHKRQNDVDMCLRFDTDTREVLIEGERVYLPQRDFEVLVYLSENRTRLVTNSELYREFWAMSGPQDDHAIAACIYRIRKKLEPDIKHPIHIQNVWGSGYVFV